MIERSNSSSLSLRRSVSIADEDVFKVPSVPTRRVAEKTEKVEKVPDIAKELEKANKAVRCTAIEVASVALMVVVDDQACRYGLSCGYRSHQR